jgi:HlyD family secretion protein
MLDVNMARRHMASMNVKTLCLALLMREPLSGYEIRKLVTEGTLAYFAEASYGSIYPALDRLEAERLVTAHEERDPGKPARRVYTITDAGRAAFLAAVHQTPGEDVFRSPFLMVAASAPLVERAHIARVIDERITHLEGELARMRAELRDIADEAEECGGGYAWTLDYGLTMVSTSLNFLREHRTRLEAVAGTATPETIVAPPREPRRAVASVALALFATLATATLAPPSTAFANDARAPSISVVAAERANLGERLQVSGTFVARDEVLVSAEIDGVAIVELLAEEGDTVAAGQVLARLDRQSLEVQRAQNEAQQSRARAAMDQARAQIAEAQANLTQADASLGRARTLSQTGATSAEILDQRVAAAAAARARLSAAQQALMLAEADLRVAETQARDIALRLSRTELRARVAGVVSRRTARLGAIAGMAGEPLFRIIADGAVELEADVPETVLARMSQGQRATIDAIGREDEIPGAVRLVAPEVNRTNRLGRVRVSLTGAARPAIGTFGRASVEVARADGVFVPLSAVLFDRGTATVQVVKDGAVEARRVRVGLRSDGRVEIREGVAAGEDVVAVSGTFLRAGDRVTPVRRQAAAN